MSDVAHIIRSSVGACEATTIPPVSRDCCRLNEIYGFWYWSSSYISAGAIHGTRICRIVDKWKSRPLHPCRSHILFERTLVRIKFTILSQIEITCANYCADYYMWIMSSCFLGFLWFAFPYFTSRTILRLWHRKYIWTRRYQYIRSIT